MADSILALTIASLGIGTLMVSQQQLAHQQDRHETKLIAARLAKESSDQLAATHRKAVIKQGHYRARATTEQIVVWKDSRMVVHLQR